MKKIINVCKALTLIFLCAQSFAQTPTIIMKPKGSYYYVDREPRVRDTIISMLVHGVDIYDMNPCVNKYIESLYGKDTLTDLFIAKVQIKCRELGITLMDYKFSGNILTFKFFYSDSMRVDYKIFCRKSENNNYVVSGNKVLPVEGHKYSQIEYTYKKFRTFYDKWKDDFDMELAKATVMPDGSRNVEHQMYHDTDEVLQLYCILVARLIKADLDVPQYWSIRLAENLHFADNLQCLKEKIIDVGLKPKNTKSVVVSNGKRTYKMEALNHSNYFDSYFMMSKTWQED